MSRIKLIAEYVMRIIDGNKDLDAYRGNLLNNIDFNLYEAFDSLDIYQNSQIPISDLKEILLSVLDINSNNQEIIRLLKIYDKDRNDYDIFSCSTLHKILIP